MLLCFVILTNLASSYLEQSVDNSNGNTGKAADMFETFHVSICMLCYRQQTKFGAW